MIFFLEESGFRERFFILGFIVLSGKFFSRIKLLQVPEEE